jgi:hypothetical protein
MIRILVAAAAVVCVACIGVTVASAAKVTGGTTAITASSAALNLLKTNHLTVSPLGAATASGATYTFPIASGKLKAKTLRGYIIHKGGLKVSNGTKTVALRVPTIISNKSGVSLWALVRAPAAHACRLASARLHQGCIVIRLVARRIATIIDVKVTGTSASGTVKITAFTAGALNKLAGKTVAAAGDTLGTATTSPTL